MADLAITASNVIPGAGAVFEHGIANAAASAGDLAYYDPVAQQYGPHDANAAGVIHALRGMFVTSPLAAGSRCSVQVGGRVAVGAVLTTGMPFIGSANPGKVAPVADLASGWFCNLIGIAFDASNLDISVVNANVAK